MRRDYDQRRRKVKLIEFVLCSFNQ